MLQLRTQIEDYIEDGFDFDIFSYCRQVLANNVVGVVIHACGRVVVVKAIYWLDVLLDVVEILLTPAHPFE